MQKYPNNLTELFILLYKRKKNIFSLAILVTIVTVIITFFIPKHYKATAIIYPYNYVAFNPKNISEENKTFGSQDDVERLQQIALSNPFVQALNKHYNLYSYYEIDTTELDKDARLYKKFYSNFDVIKNAKGALEINYLHKNPVIGSDIVNTGIKYIDSVNQSNYISNYKKTYAILQKTIQEKDSALLDLQNKDVSKSSYEKSTVSIAYIENIKLKEQLRSVNLLLNTPITSIAIIEPATPNYKKESPKFIINVSVAVVSSILTYVLFLLVSIWYKNSIKELL